MSASTQKMQVRARRVIGVVASIIGPGLGHAFLGRWRRTAFWYSLYALALLLAPISFWAFAACFVVTRVGAAVDVGLVRAPAELPQWRISIAVAVICVAVWVGVSTTARLFYVEAFRIPAGSMAPTLLIGDRIFVEKYDKDVTRGDVVVFGDPCGSKREFVKRAVAVAGDTVELRCATLFVNGEAVSRELLNASASYMDVDYVSGRDIEENVALYRESLDSKNYDVFEPPRLADDIKGAEKTGTAFLFEGDFPRENPPSCMDGSAVPGEIEASTGDLKVCSPKRHFVVPEGHFFALGDNRANSADSRSWGPVPVANVTGKAVYVWWSSGVGAIRWGRIGKKIR